MSRYTIPVWRMIVGSLKKSGLEGDFLTNKEIADAVHRYYENEDVKDSTIRLQTIFHCINHPSRFHSAGQVWKTNPLFIMDEYGRFRLLTEEERKEYVAEPVVEGMTQELPEEQEEDTLEFAVEAMLEEYIFRNWNNIDFGESLELYEGRKGRQFHTEVGIIDFLCKNKNSGDFVVIELKKGRKSDEVLGQILRYIGWVKNNIAKDGNVKGIIVTGDADKKLDIAASAVPFISVKHYRVRFDLYT